MNSASRAGWRYLCHFYISRREAHTSATRKITEVYNAIRKDLFAVLLNSSDQVNQNIARVNFAPLEVSKGALDFFELNYHDVVVGNLNSERVQLVSPLKTCIRCKFCIVTSQCLTNGLTDLLEFSVQQRDSNVTIATILAVEHRIDALPLSTAADRVVELFVRECTFVLAVDKAARRGAAEARGARRQVGVEEFEKVPGYLRAQISCAELNQVFSLSWPALVALLLPCSPIVASERVVLSLSRSTRP